MGKKELFLKQKCVWVQIANAIVLLFLMNTPCEMLNVKGVVQEKHEVFPTLMWVEWNNNNNNDNNKNKGKLWF